MDNQDKLVETQKMSEKLASDIAFLWKVPLSSVDINVYLWDDNAYKAAGESKWTESATQGVYRYIGEFVKGLCLTIYKGIHYPIIKP